MTAPKNRPAPFLCPLCGNASDRRGMECSGCAPEFVDCESRFRSSRLGPESFEPARFDDEALAVARTAVALGRETS